MIHFDIIVAVDLERGIGKEGKLPWHLSGDLKHFKEITSRTQEKDKKNAVIMGRKTWDSIPASFRPLPARINVILSRNESLQLPKDVHRTASLKEALDFLQKKKEVESIFIIGGSEVFAEAVKFSSCRKIYLTQILDKFSCDVFFPKFNSEFKELSQSKHYFEDLTEYYFAEFIRK